MGRSCPAGAGPARRRSGTARGRPRSKPESRWRSRRGGRCPSGRSGGGGACHLGGSDEGGRIVGRRGGGQRHRWRVYRLLPASPNSHAALTARQHAAGTFSRDETNDRPTRWRPHARTHRHHRPAPRRRPAARLRRDRRPGDPQRVQRRPRRPLPPRRRRQRRPRPDLRLRRRQRRQLVRVARGRRHPTSAAGSSRWGEDEAASDGSGNDLRRHDYAEPGTPCGPT